jgi:hypothetical protein
MLKIRKTRLPIYPFATIQMSKKSNVYSNLSFVPEIDLFFSNLDDESDPDNIVQ